MTGASPLVAREILRQFLGTLLETGGPGSAERAVAGWLLESDPPTLESPPPGAGTAETIALAERVKDDLARHARLIRSSDGAAGDLAVEVPFRFAWGAEPPEAIREALATLEARAITCGARRAARG